MASLLRLPEPSLAFLRPRRAVPRRRFRRDVPGLSSIPHQVYFTLAALMGFRLQGFLPPGDRVVFPRLILPCRCRIVSDGPLDFEGLLPPGSGL